MRDSFTLKKGGEFFVGLHYESATIAPMRVCHEKHAASGINLRRTAPRPMALSFDK
jgi:hypothetical protein